MTVCKRICMAFRAPERPTNLLYTQVRYGRNSTARLWPIDYPHSTTLGLSGLICNMGPAPFPLLYSRSHGEEYVLLVGLLQVSSSIFSLSGESRIIIQVLNPDIAYVRSVQLFSRLTPHSRNTPQKCIVTGSILPLVNRGSVTSFE